MGGMVEAWQTRTPVSERGQEHGQRQGRGERPGRSEAGKGRVQGLQDFQVPPPPKLE